MPECLTCGFPNLRSEGHADWCEPWEHMDPAEKMQAVLEMAAEKGLRYIDAGDTVRSRLRQKRRSW